jgi:hypothetical protein
MLNVLVEVMIAQYIRCAVTNDHLYWPLLRSEQSLYLLNGFLTRDISFDHGASLNGRDLEQIDTHEAPLIDYISAHLSQSLRDDLWPRARRRT